MLRPKTHHRGTETQRMPKATKGISRLQVVVCVMSMCLFAGKSAAGQDSAGGGHASAQQNPSGTSTQVTCTPPNVVKQIDKHRFQWAGPGVVSPQPISTPLPDTPEQIRTKGKVTLCIGINETGDIEQIQIVRSVSKDFDDFAVNSVNQWKFAPATKGGRPIPVFINVDVEAKKVDPKAHAVN